MSVNILYYGRLTRSVTVFPLKTRFINMSTAILMYFVNTTLKFSAILHGKFKFNLTRSSLKIIIVYSPVCLIFDRLDFQPDKIYVFTSL